MSALKKENTKLKDQQKKSLADQKFQLKKEKDQAVQMKDLKKQIDELKKQNEKLTNEKHELDKELQNQKFEVSKSIKYENQLNYDIKELKLKHKKEMAALKEIHDAKYKAMEKVEERLLEDLAMYERRED